MNNEIHGAVHEDTHLMHSTTVQHLNNIAEAHINEGDFYYGNPNNHTMHMQNDSFNMNISRNALEAGFVVQNETRDQRLPRTEQRSINGDSFRPSFGVEHDESIYQKINFHKNLNYDALLSESSQYQTS